MQTLNSCGCCEGLATETPVPVYNRPGLSVISYRVGDHARFKASLLTRLSASGFGTLRALTTRDNDDFTIALLDAWATTADVLSFYQERIANESYLGTATEQVSLVELARLIGYELRPGVAAGTYLAFTIDENTGSTGQLASSAQSGSKPEAVVSIEAGTRAQSVPGPDEQPQSFETMETIAARPQWNAIRPRQTQPQPTVADNTVVVISGTGNDLKEGDVVLITTGSKLKKAVKTVVQDEAKTTWLYLDASTANLPAYALPSLTPTGQVSDFPQQVPLSAQVVTRIVSKTWKEEDLSALIKMQAWKEADLKESMANERAKQALVAEKIYVFRKRASVFGYNAQQYMFTSDGKPSPPPWREWNLSSAEADDKLWLDTVYDKILPNSWIAIQQSTESLQAAKAYQAKEVEHRSRTDYGISTKTTVITTSQAWWTKNSKDNLAFLRGIVVYAQAEPLLLAETPINDSVSGNLVVLDNFYPGLKKGTTVILSGDRADLPGTRSAELRVLADVFIAGGLTVLKLDQRLTYSYIRSSVHINANVAAATHGETVKETLGSGDAAKPFQKFVLKQPPLTFTSAATPSGTLSTLQIRVNDILWKEVPSLYDQGPGDHVYTTRQDDQGKTTVVFGDGKTGARLPTGQENVKALYRKGIGTAGLLKANQLSQLVTRPLGVKEVTNPLPTSGAEDSENIQDARRNATLTIFTLDRIVSLQDYEDFARSFAGIAKSLATWTWNRQKRVVFLTVAGVAGAPVTDKLYTKLTDAIKNASIPDAPFRVASFQPRFFRITANVQIHPDYIKEQVLASVEQRLRESFSFAKRAFGQSVHLSEVVTVMQNVEGVTAVDVDALYLSGQPSILNNRIDADAPRPGSETPLPAELLTLDPGPLTLNLIP